MVYLQSVVHVLTGPNADLLRQPPDANSFLSGSFAHRPVGLGLGLGLDIAGFKLNFDRHKLTKKLLAKSSTTFCYLHH